MRLPRPAALRPNDRHLQDGLQARLGGGLRATLTNALLALAALSGAACENLQVDAITPPTESVPTGDFPVEPAPPLREIELAAANQPERQTLSVDDAIRFLIWGHPELAHEAVVNPNGAVTLPLAGEVVAAGRTPDELARDVEDILRGRIDEAPLKLRREDVVRLSVWQHPDLTHEAIVQMDGFITLPLIGDVLAADRTIGEVRADVTERLDKFLSDPQVSILPLSLNRPMIPNPQVSILTTRLKPRQVAVIGEVQLQGLQPLNGPTRALDVLSRAGYRDTAKLNSVIVIRGRDGATPEYRQLQLADFIRAEAPDQNIYLQPDDIVIVPKTTIARVGTFVEQFFTRTKPVFDWWIAAQQARYAEELFESNVLINNQIFGNLQ